MGPAGAFVLLAWILLASVLVAGARLVLRWRRGRAARVDWWAGLVALPRRYLVDVHGVVARDPRAARMHALTAGGLLGSSGLLLLGVVPALRAGVVYWVLVATSFAVALAGSAMVARRRRPVRPAHLSAGGFLWLPVWVFLYAAGGLAGAGAIVLTASPGLGFAAVVLAAVGGAGLVSGLLTGPIRHALAGAVHLVAHPRPGRFAGRRESALLPLDLEAARLGVAVAEDFAWNRLVGFDACIQCGRCELACPAFAAGQRLNPKKLIQDLAAASLPPGARPAYEGSPHPGAPPPPLAAGPIVGAVLHPDTLWACTTCRACVAACPMFIEHVDAVVDLRRHASLEEGALPEKAAAVLEAIRHTDEPEGNPLAARGDFAAGLELPVLGAGESTDVLLWLGAGAFDLRYGRSLRALVTLLRRAGVAFAVLGAEERDCGDLARRLGDEVEFARLARANIAALNARRFARIVTADPHALHVLRNEYPDFGGCYTVVHHSALLESLLAEGRLTPERRLAGRIVYHDPCYLARYNGETGAPRRLLDRIAPERVEMARHGLSAMCCGGGGGAPVSDVEAVRRIPDLRMAQAREVGAQTLAVACPGCTAMLEGVPEPRPPVRDLAELVLEAVGEG